MKNWLSLRILVVDFNIRDCLLMAGLPFALQSVNH